MAWKNVHVCVWYDCFCAGVSVYAYMGVPDMSLVNKYHSEQLSHFIC